jgi:ACS family glucarate transporter-like MFS transporter
VTEAESAAPTGHVRWVILAFIMVAAAVAYMTRYNLSFVGPKMIEDLGLTTIQLGVVFSAFSAGYTLFQFPSGVFGGRYGARRVVAIILVAWGILTAITGALPGSGFGSASLVFALLLVVRFLLGVAQAPVFPVTGGATANWFPIGKWGLPNGLASTALTLASAVTGPLLIWLVSLYGWRGSFFLTAPVGLAFGWVWWWYVRDLPRDHSSVKPAELALINANRPDGLTAGEQKGAWKRVLVNRDLLLLTASYFCMNFVFFLFFNWIFFYLTEVKGFSNETAAGMTAAQWIMGAVGATLGGFACDRFIWRFGLRRGPQILVIPSLMLCGISLVLGAISTNPVVMVCFLCASFGLTQVTEAAYWSTMYAVARRSASEGGGMMNTGGNLVGAIGGVLVPIVAHSFGWTVAISMGGVFAFAGAALWFWVRGDRPMDGG